MTSAAATGAVVRRTAWAKINLTLHITGRRADGYHELDSLIVFAGLGDERVGTLWRFTRKFRTRSYTYASTARYAVIRVWARFNEAQIRGAGNQGFPLPSLERL